MSGGIKSHKIIFHLDNLENKKKNQIKELVLPRKADNSLLTF